VRRSMAIALLLLSAATTACTASDGGPSDTAAGSSGSSEPAPEAGSTSTMASSIPSEAGATSIDPTGAVSIEGGILVTGVDGSVSIAHVGGSVTEISPSASPGLAVQPTPSPDGSSVAFTAIDSAGEPVTTIRSEAGSQDVDFGFIPFFYAWSADGSRLAALGNGPGGVTAAIAEAGTDLVVEAGAAAPHFLAWSPDGSMLASHRGGIRVDVVSIGGASRTAVETTAEFQAPDWLSDEEVLAAVIGSELEATAGAVQVSPSTARLVGVAPDGSVREILDVQANSMFDVDPTLTRVAVFDGPLGDGRLRTIDLVSGETETLDAPGVVAFEWSPDGSRLLTMSISEDGLVPEVWNGSNLESGFAAFTPTSTYLREYLPFWGQYVRTFRSWSPDGGSFVYAAATVDGDMVFVQTVVGGEPDGLVEGSMAQWLP
jgi:TolB protein